MINLLERHPDRLNKIREIGIQEGLNLSGNIKDDWHTVVLAADAENWGDDWEEMFRSYCQDIVNNKNSTAPTEGEWIEQLWQESRES